MIPISVVFKQHGKVPASLRGAKDFWKSSNRKPGKFPKIEEVKKYLRRLNDFDPNGN